MTAADRNPAGAAGQRETVDCLLLPQFDCNLLVPAALVADVLPGDALDIVVDLQGGLLGKLQWRGWTVPLLSFEAVLSEGIPRYNAQTRSALLYSLSDDPTQPFIALTVQGEPKPLRVGPPQTCGRSTAGTATSCRAGC